MPDMMGSTGVRSSRTVMLKLCKAVSCWSTRMQPSGCNTSSATHCNCRHVSTGSWARSAASTSNELRQQVI
jgi:hypothetical protein